MKTVKQIKESILSRVVARTKGESTLEERMSAAKGARLPYSKTVDRLAKELAGQSETAIRSAIEKMDPLDIVA